MANKLGVRELVELTLRAGDLAGTNGSTNSALLGGQIHRRLQKSRGANFQKEYYLELPVALAGREFLVHGRADGVTLSPGTATIEEIKTSDVPFDKLSDNTRDLYWAQVKMYAHLLMSAEDYPEVTLALTYFQTTTEEITQQTQPITRAAAADFFNMVVHEYERWLIFRQDLIARRDPAIQQLTFPFKTYRQGQRDLAVAVYKTIAAGRELFVEAPTGTGKTISTLFPTIKAMGEGLIQRVFYLTAKQSTRTVAEDGIDLMAAHGLLLKSITLTAKDKIQFAEEANLLPEENPYMLGYYDRLKPAILDMVGHEEQLTRPVIEQYARKHTLDPFEFQLDASLFCDVIICDYNYLFDPQVHLQRFFSTEDADNFFLIDEAHNLVSRSRDMYSAALSNAPLAALIQESQTANTSTPKLNRRLKDLQAAFDDLAQPLIANGVSEQTLSGQDDAFNHDLGRLVEGIHEWLVDQPNIDFTQHILAYYFQCLSYQRIIDLYDETYRLRLVLTGGDVVIKQLCLDPSAFLAETLSLGRGAVLFSATLSPTAYYQRVLGGKANSLSYRLPSPFPPHHQALLVTNYIQTTYRQREANLAKILVAIKTLVSGKLGNYLIFLPSYSYLMTVSEAFHLAYPDIATTVQQATMDEATRAAFLDQFLPDPPQTLVGFVVLGGIFAEGIDLKAGRLIGVGIVGVGLPGINPETDLIRDYFDQQTGHGFAYAYQLPGMNNVFQAAGRLIRGARDVGVVLLMDQRFTARRYTELFPAHWQHWQRLYQPAQLTTAIDHFWQEQDPAKPAKEVTPHENQTHS